jgi:uncharacterized membrane protein YoaK (UPF0700 family)
MISRLPRWVWAGGAVLAFIAGMINAVGFMSFQHQGVTHLTGSATLAGIAVASHDGFKALRLGAVIAAFVAGAAFSGFLIRDSTLRLGRRYGVALLAESALLFCAVPLLRRDLALGAYLASCACGLQNAMASTYSGATLRSTHVSGAFTDLGIFLGQFLRGMPVDRRRVWLCLVLTSAFFGGGVAGATFFHVFAYGTLYIPAALTGVTGLSYGIYRHRLIRASRGPFAVS